MRGRRGRAVSNGLYLRIISRMNEPVLILEAGRTEKNYWADLWRYRELFLILAWRDVSVRYKQTIIGVGWAILLPMTPQENKRRFDGIVNFRCRWKSKPTAIAHTP